MTSAAIDDRKAYYGRFLCISIAVVMATLDASIVNVSLPSIAAWFKVDSGGVSQVVLSFLLFLSSTLLICGKIADVFGVVRVFMWGQGLFLVSSLACGLAPTLGILNAARAVQGIGGAMLTVTSYALTPSLVPENLRGWAFGLVATSAAVGTMFGAPLGGILSGYLSWHWIFLVNVPVGLVGIVLSKRILAPLFEGKGKTASTGSMKGFDWVGAVTSFLAVLVLLFALNRGGEIGWSSPTILGALALSSLLFPFFVWWEKRFDSPLLDMSLLSIPAFRLSVLGAIPVFMFLMGNSFLMPFYLQGYKGMTPQGASLILLAYSTVYMATSLRVGRMADRIPPNRIAFFGALSAASASLFFVCFLGLSGLVVPVVFMLWMALSMGGFFAPNNSVVMGSAPPALRGAASGFFTGVSRFAMVVGVSVFETVYAEFLDAASSHSSMVAGFRWSWGLGVVLLLWGAYCMRKVPNVDRERSGERTISGPE